MRGLTSKHKALTGAGVLAALVGVSVAYLVWFHVRIVDYPVPPRSDIPAEYPAQRSTIVTSIAVPVARIRQGLEQQLPRTMVKIDQRVEECVPRKTISVLGQDIIKSPRIGCNLVGDVRRGSLTLSGSGRTLTGRFPVTAEIQIRDIGDIIKRETATASAMMEVRATLDVAPDWSLRPDLRIGYKWLEEPGIVFAGQRITFTRQADKELAKILREVERELEAQIRALDLRAEVAEAWRSGFANISLNRENPPVWLRLSPAQAGSNGVRVDGNHIAAGVQLEADLQVIVGEEPDPPSPRDLGPNIGVQGQRGFDVTIPVLADYSEVEPVILRALRKLADKGIRSDDLGALEVDFEQVSLFSSDNGRIAVGIEAEVEPVGNLTGRIWGRSRGTIWLTGDPVSEANSEVVRVEGLQIYGDMDSSVGDLLVRVLQSDGVLRAIERELVEDFKHDYEDVVGKARAGIGSVKVGEFELAFDVDTIEHGPISATGEGLFMPVTASGDVTTRLQD